MRRFLVIALLLFGTRPATGAVSVSEGSVDVLIDARTSAQAVTLTEAPRLGALEQAAYVGIVRFPVQPGAKYTLLEIYPAEPTHRMLLTGYYPLSQDKRPIKGRDGSRTGQSVKLASKTGRWGYRSNFSIDPKSNGHVIYYVYFSETPSVAFQVQLLSKQVPDAEVSNNNESSYSGAKGYFWGDSDVGQVFAETLPDEPERKPGSGDSLVTTTKPPGGVTGGRGTTTGTTGRDRDGNLPTARGTTIQVGTRRAVSGQTVTVPVQLQNGKDLASLNVIIEYDARAAKPTERPAVGPVYESLDPVLFEANHDEIGIIRFGHATTDRLNGSGQLTFLSFRVTGAPGTVIPLQVRVTSAHDSAGQALTPGTISGEIRIEADGSTSTGDPDGDGVATIADARSALKMSVKLLPEDLVCDVDGDGTVTANDARVLLARATAE